MSVLGASFALLLILGVPIAYTLGIAGVAGLLALDFDLVTVPLRMFASTDSFVLLAAPFFILVGDVMARGRAQTASVQPRMPLRHNITTMMCAAVSTLPRILGGKVQTVL